MTTVLQPIHSPAAPTRLGQGTAVEQSRAIAEVQAAIVVAQQCPRSVTRAIDAMRTSCSQPALAARAFFRYSRAGSQVTGASVHLARELARTWGNIQYGITELRRDDDYGQSEMQAWAWDVETNARSSNTFIVPHTRDTRDGRKRLEDARDIYENNANAGARRLREAIFSVLPGWFVEEAKEICDKTLADGGGKPLATRIADAVKVFAAIGVSEAQLAAKVGSKPDQWTAHDVAQLGVIYQSVQRGEARKEDEFPAERVTAAEIAAQAQAPAEPPKRQQRQRKPHLDQGEQGINLPPSGQPEPKAATGQVGIIHTHFGRLGYEDADRGERLAFTAMLAGVDEIESTKDLTQDQAARVIEALKACPTRDALIERLYPSESPMGGDSGE